MLIDWPKFIVALILLLSPTSLLHGKKVRFRPISGEWERHWMQIFTLGSHTIDLARAAAGAWFLAASLQTAPGARGLLRYGVIVTEASVFAVAVALQTLICKEKGEANAPFAFLIGLTAGFIPPVIAGFALAVAIVAAAGSGVPAAFFPVLGLAISGMGFLFTGKKYLFDLATVSCCALLPWLLSLLFSRELMMAYRERRADESRSSGSTSRSPFR